MYGAKKAWIKYYFKEAKLSTDDQDLILLPPPSGPHPPPPLSV